MNSQMLGWKPFFRDKKDKPILVLFNNGSMFYGHYHCHLSPELLTFREVILYTESGLKIELGTMTVIQKSIAGIVDGPVSL